MKKLTAIIIVTICIICSSCTPAQNDHYSEDSYLEGILQGREDMFIDMWMASSDVAILDLGDTWKTDHFTLKIDKNNVESESSIEFDLTLNEMTIEECASLDKMLFNIYSINDGSWNMVLGYDNYYDYAALNYLNGNHGVGHVGLYSDAQYFVAIIIIDSCIYTARYSASI